jgi:glycosyltransferase 2 family protein
MRKNLKSMLTQILKLAFALGLIYWLISSDRLDFKALSRLLQPIYLLPCLLCVGTSLALGVERWRQFLKSQNLSIPFFKAFQLSLIGLFFNYTMPGGVGGDLVKGYYIARASSQAKIKAAATVLLDRLIGLLAMSLIALVIMISKWEFISQQRELRLAFLMVSGVTAASILIWSLIFSRRLYNLGWIEKILKLLPKSATLLHTYNSITDFRHSKKVFFTTLGLSFAAQFSSILFFVFAGQALGYDVPVTTYLVVVPIAFMIQSIPLSPGGIGIGQTASFFLFNSFSPGTGPLGTSTTTAHQIAQFLYGLLGAYFYLGISKKLKNSTTSPSSTTTEEFS